MPTNRNVIDFKIHNLTEEQFQELKAQGKIDPNAIYCTPDDSLKTSQITNCITEIPQDIKLELADGVLTIKAGSKIYYPNGSGVFNEIVLTDDRTYTDTTKTGQWFLCMTRSYAGVVGSVANSVSGTTPPTAGYSLWYNTEENIMYRYGSITSDPASNISFPIAIITLNETGVASIDQVFNGFGYIGSVLFALPGVKGLVPNGRNNNGTLNNQQTTLNEVSVYTKTGNYQDLPMYMTYKRLYNATSGLSYNEETNYFEDKSGTHFGVFLCGYISSVGSGISFRPRTTFHAVDYNDFEALSDTVETLSDTVETLSDTVETNNNNAVHKTGDETVGGTKTFTAPSLRISNEAGTGGTGLNILDSNGKGQTYLHHFYTGGRYYSRLVNRNATAAKTSYVEVVVNDDGKSEFTSYNVDNMYAPTPASTSNGTNIATTAWANAKFLTSSAGLVAPFAGKTAPSGWLKCDGSAVSRTTYAALFAVIGTTYGAGNGSTTFNLPTQSVLPLGTTAPVIGNGKAIGMTGTNSGVLVARDIGTDAGTVHGVLSITNNEHMPNGTLYKFTDSTGLKADLASATGAKAIVCIKY